MKEECKCSEPGDGLSRRDFLAGTALVTGTAAVVGLWGCTPSQESSQKKESDGNARENVDEAKEKLVPTRVENYDIVVVGTGTAGTCAAMRAAELGSHVAVLEKLEEPGGTSNFAEGLCGVASKMQKEMGIDVTVEEIFKRIADYHHWTISGPALRSYLDASGATIDWLLDLGVPFVDVIGLGGSAPVWHVFETDGRCGPNIIEPLTKKASDLGATYYFSTPAKELLLENGKAKGVVAQTSDGEVIEFDAPAVLMCTGGFADNAEMFEKYAGTDLNNLFNFGIPGRDGDGINMGISANAALHHPSAVMYCGALVEGTTIMHEFLNLIMTFQPNMYVNGDGARFFDEGIVSDFTTFGNALAEQAESFSIIDARYIDILENQGIFNGHPTSGNPAGTKLSGITAALDESSAIIKADTIEELAEKLGIASPETLAKTVEKYNGYALAGVDAEYGKDAAFLQPLDTPPFYGTKIKRTFFATCGGLRINDKMQVLDTDDTPIDGLYACGGDAGGAYGTSYDVGVTSGSQQGWAGTTGRLAAEYANDALA
jgi:fumarate reductase flavoprotein subunit